MRMITIDILYPLFLALLPLALTSCSDNRGNERPAPSTNAGYEAKLDQLERQVSTLSTESEYHGESFNLNQATVQRCNTYITQLHDALNETRPQHLPEWQQMYDALTSDAALDPSFTLGRPGRATNFSKQKARIDFNEQHVGEVDQASRQNRGRIVRLSNTQSIHGKRLGTIDRNIADINRVMNAKFKEVEKLINDYDGRIKGVENRMKTVETAMADVKKSIDRVDNRLRAIELLLQQYDIANMHRRIGLVEDDVRDHEARLVDTETRLTINENKVTDLEDAMIETQLSVTRINGELGLLKTHYFSHIDHPPQP